MKKFLILFLFVVCLTFTLIGCTITSNGDSDSDSIATDTDINTDSDSDSDTGGDVDPKLEEEITLKTLNGKFIKNDGGYSSLHTRSIALIEEGENKNSISADVCPNGSESDNGLIFAFSSTVDSNVWEGEGISYYFYFVSKSGTAYLGKTDDGTWSVLGEKTIAAFNVNNTYNLKAEYVGGKIYCYVNGSLNAVYTDEAPLTGNKCGLRANGTGISFYNIKVNEASDMGLPLNGYQIKSGAFIGGGNVMLSSADDSLAIKDETYSDATISVSAAIPSAGYTGIVFGYDDGKYYLFAATSDRYVGLYKYDGTQLNEIKKTSLVAKYSNGTMVALKVCASNEGVYTYIDDVCLVCQSGLEVNGNIGVYTSFANNVLCDFDIEEGGKKLSADLVMWGHSHMQLWDDYKTDLDGYGKIINMGIGGSDTVYWSKLIDEINSYGASKMVVMTGSNDYGAGASAEFVLQYVQQIFDLLWANNPNLQIVLIDEFLQPCRLQYTDETNTLNQYYFMMQEKYPNLTVVDSYDIVLDKDGSLNESIFRDIYHIKKEGYDVLASRVRNALDGKYLYDNLKNYDEVEGTFLTNADGSTITTIDGGIALRKSVSLKRAQVDINVKLSEQNGKAGIVFAYGDEGYYKFLYVSGKASLYKVGDSEIELKSVEKTLSDSFTMTVYYNDGEIICKFDDETVIEYFDADSAFGGRIGVECGAETYFSNMRIDMVTGKYNFTVGTEDDWQITKDSNGGYVYTSLAKSIMLMFNDKTFKGGTVEFDMIVNGQTDDHGYYVANGIVFGADTLDANVNVGNYYVFGRCPWATMTGFAKNYGAFNWEEVNRPSTLVEVGTLQRYKYVFDNVNNRVMIYKDGILKETSLLKTTFNNGVYVGIWCDSANTVISNLTFTEQVFEKINLENDDFTVTTGDRRAWDVYEGAEGEKTYKCLSSDQMIMFKDKTLDGGFIEFDMTVYGQTDEHKFYVANGVVFGANRPLTNVNNGSYYVFGRCPWGSFTGFAKEDGAFNWEDTQKVFFCAIQTGQKQHYKLKYNKTEHNVWLYTSETEYTVCPLTKAFEGQYLGLYISAPGTEISNLRYYQE